MAHALRVVSPSNRAERTTRTTVDTISFLPDEIRSWVVPPEFQRQLAVNNKVKSLSLQIQQEGGVLPGILTIGILTNDKNQQKYLIDGQHRREAFLISAAPVGYADVRFLFCETMADMGREFVNLNSHLVNMRPDDILRGLEGCLPVLAKIRTSCHFVGYDNIRRGNRNAIVSMSALLRSWAASSFDVPTPGGVHGGAKNVAECMTDEDCTNLIRFLQLAYTALGRDQEYYRLWGNLNLTLCMWLYRRIVLSAYSSRTVQLDDSMFTKCMMSLSADSIYVDWLVGRNMGDRDRSPAYGHIKRIFASRLYKETGVKHQLPAPPWASK